MCLAINIFYKKAKPFVVFFKDFGDVSISGQQKVFGYTFPPLLKATRAFSLLHTQARGDYMVVSAVEKQSAMSMSKLAKKCSWNQKKSYSYKIFGKLGWYFAVKIFSMGSFKKPELSNSS